jgi:hypothetical protein
MVLPTASERDRSSFLLGTTPSVVVVRTSSVTREFQRMVEPGDLLNNLAKAWDCGTYNKRGQFNLRPYRGLGELI